MTEVEWLHCRNPQVLLNDRLARVRDRKLRLFACACCRRVWDLLTDPRSRQAVETAERFADGQATEVELRAAWETACRAASEPRQDEVGASLARVAYAARMAASHSPWTAAREALWETSWDVGAVLLHDILGNPFRPVSVDPRWLKWHEKTVVHLAQALYEERRFEDMPILGDALEEAGCTNEHLLEHCRSPRPHVRGCWVVDLVLSKDR